jgi:hypothetical protein
MSLQSHAQIHATTTSRSATAQAEGRGDANLLIAWELDHEPPSDPAQF